MAGGCGARLGELTRWHSKPALPFAGQYRNIDFPLSNCVNSGLRRVAVATQANAHSLIQHLRLGWGFLRSEIGDFVEVWPAQQRAGSSWYCGTADCIYQNMDLVHQHRPEQVLILAGDHVYHMDYGEMLEDHRASGADVTVGCFEVPIECASRYGVIQTDRHGQVVDFSEKPLHPAAIPGDASKALVSMGIYVFERDFLEDCLGRDAQRTDSSHDFGRDVFPRFVGSCDVRAYSFRGLLPHRKPYWRDVGTVDAYWLAHMELLDDDPSLDLYDDRWPMWTHQRQCPPAVCTGSGMISRSIVSGGCRVAGRVERSVLARSCVVQADARVEASVVLPNAVVGRGCRISNAIVESGCEIPDGFQICGRRGDAGSAFAVSAGGVVLVTREAMDRADTGSSRGRASGVTYLNTGSAH